MNDRVQKTIITIILIGLATIAAVVLSLLGTFQQVLSGGL